jgi:hypothetical protein
MLLGDHRILMYVSWVWYIFKALLAVVVIITSILPPFSKHDNIVDPSASFEIDNNA